MFFLTSRMLQNFTDYLTMSVKYLEAVKRRLHATKQWSPNEIRVWQFYYNKFNKAIKVFKIFFNACFFFSSVLLKIWWGFGSFKSNGAPRMVNLQNSKIFLQAMQQFPLPILIVGNT